MCGIIAFLGYISGIKQSYEGIIILQNRGYDSAGISGIIDNKFILRKYVNLKPIYLNLGSADQVFKDG